MFSIRKSLLAFVIGSSLLSTIITFTYVGSAYRSVGRPSDIPYEIFPIFIAGIFGLFNIVSMEVSSRYGINSSFVVGAIMGLLLSIIGRFGLQLPTRIFGFTDTSSYRVHIVAPILYGVIFRFLIQPLNEYIVHN